MVLFAFGCKPLYNTFKNMKRMIIGGIGLFFSLVGFANSLTDLMNYLKTSEMAKTDWTEYSTIFLIICIVFVAIFIAGFIDTRKGKR